MAGNSIFERFAAAGAWTRQLGLAGFFLVSGFAIMPLLIFLAGSSALGRYEGASVPRLYGSLYQGLAGGSFASWIVVLGPYGLYLLWRALRLWWQAGA